MSARRARSVVVIGAGHNGLVCAALLARRGLEVTVVDALATAGGMAGTHRFTEGFRVPHCAHLLPGVDGRVQRALGLSAHGFAGVLPVRTLALHPQEPALVLDGPTVEVDTTLAPSARSGASIGERDRQQYARLHRRMQRFAGVLAVMGRLDPPRMGAAGVTAQLDLVRFAWSARSLDRASTRELLRVVTGNVHDLLEDSLDHPRVRAALAMDGVLGASAGPRSGNTVLNLLHRLASASATPTPGHGARGTAAAAIPRDGGGVGLEAFVSALVLAAREQGVVIRSGASVARLLTTDGAVTGVALASGEELAADAVVSSLDPATTLTDLAGDAWFGADVEARVRRLRTEGRSAKLHLGLSRMPRWRGVGPLDEHARGRQLRLLPVWDLDAVERAFDASKYGELPAQPMLEVTLPSLHDHTLCPPGRHVLSAIVQHVPLHPREPDPSRVRADLQTRCLQMLAQVAPDIMDCVEAAQVLLPQDLAKRFGSRGGHWHHVELGADQFATLRPAPGMARYAGPVPGLYFCGASTHPGGGVTGTCGWNAARAVLAGRRPDRPRAGAARRARP